MDSIRRKNEQAARELGYELNPNRKNIFNKNGFYAKINGEFKNDIIGCDGGILVTGYCSDLNGILETNATRISIGDHDLTEIIAPKCGMLELGSLLGLNKVLVEMYCETECFKNSLEKHVRGRLCFDLEVSNKDLTETYILNKVDLDFIPVVDVLEIKADDYILSGKNRKKNKHE